MVLNLLIFLLWVAILALNSTTVRVYYVNEAADEKTFKTQAEKAKILHLAMHALSDNDNPAQSRLLFTKNKADTLNDNDLTVAELNTLSLKADLAVLSACNTGFGKVNKGEGVMSIARSFHAAGVPATVMSLWKVPDTETSELMIDFYKKLKSGLPKDEALRQAKLNYLNHVKLDSKASPLYWSAFVLSGSTDVVDFETPLSIWYWILGIGGLIMGFLLIFYSKKKAQLGF
jgi:CHAT domain-containing protein